MALNNPYQKYQQNSVISATPEELTHMLYSGGVRFIRQGIECIENGETEGAHKAIVRAQEIYSHLADTLNTEIEISAQLASLYDFINNHLMQANIKKTPPCYGKSWPWPRNCGIPGRRPCSRPAGRLPRRVKRYAKMEARQKIAASKIASLLEKKNSFLKEFLRLTARQKQALAEKDMDRFNELMEAKQSIIEQVDILDEKLVLHKNKSRETAHNEAGSSSGKPPMENPDRIT